MEQAIHVCSEIGRLRKVLLHRPGGELENLMPEYLERLLFDDIPYLEEARREHDAFADCLRKAGVEVLYLSDLVAESFTSPEIRQRFVSEFLTEGGVTEERQRRALEDFLAPLGDKALVEQCMAGIRKSQLRRGGRLSDFTAAGEEDYPFAIDPLPNLYFTRDPFACIGGGVSLHRMHTVTRNRETLFGKFLFEYHPKYKNVPRWYDRGETSSLEGGDILVLSPEVLAVGISERTREDSIDALAETVLRESPTFQKVLAVSIPKSRSFMHLDTVFTQADVDIFTVHPAILGTLTVFELTRGARVGEVSIRQLDQTLDAILARALGLDGVRLIKCGGDDAIAAAREQWNDGSNTLAVRPGTVMVYQRNTVTNDILCREGLNLLEVPSAELSRGRGGPHCMSMAFWREDL